MEKDKVVFCTVGSEKYQFNRLMHWMETIAAEFSGYKFFIQYGSCNYIPQAGNIKSFKFLTEAEFISYFNQADILVGHCGEGTILQATEQKKPYILVPRDHTLGEHVDGHQFELARLLNSKGAGIAFTLDDFRNKLVHPKFVEFVIDHANTVNILNNLIRKSENDKNPINFDSKIMLICSGGGHYNSMKLLKDFYNSFKDRIWVTFKVRNIEIELENQSVVWAHHPTIRNVPNFFRNFLLALKVIPKLRPRIIITTGAGVAVPFLIIAKVFCGAKIIFVELATRVERLSLSAKILYELGVIDQCLVRHENLKNIYKESSKIILIES